MNGFKSFDENSVTIPLWTFNEREHDYFEGIVGNIDSHYGNYNVTKSEIQISLKDNYTSTPALKSFSDWYKLVYGDSIAYAQIHAKLVVSSASLGEFEDALLERGIVATHIEGPTQNVVNQTNQSMISDNEFILVSGVVGVMVSVVGIYFDAVVVSYRKFKKFLNKKVKR